LTINFADDAADRVKSRVKGRVKETIKDSALNAAADVDFTARAQPRHSKDTAKVRIPVAPRRIMCEIS
jgi:hypothetical protein